MAIIDCGIGNLFSISCALRNIGLEANVFAASQRLGNVEAIILPGVGNFEEGARNLQVLRENMVRLVEDGVPLFGICLGMQLLFEESEEGHGVGLSLMRGRVLRLPQHVKAPHMGWNTLRVSKPNELLEGVKKEDHFYFVHSYYPSPTERGVVVAETDYGLTFASVVSKANIYGVQFHPEKSGKQGERVLRNFARIVKR